MNFTMGVSQCLTKTPSIIAMRTEERVVLARAFLKNQKGHSLWGREGWGVAISLILSKVIVWILHIVVCIDEKAEM